LSNTPGNLKKNASLADTANGVAIATPAKNEISESADLDAMLCSWSVTDGTQSAKPPLLFGGHQKESAWRLSGGQRDGIVKNVTAEGRLRA
jgi:hypothetical protein